ncbi:Hypothetical predicted protein [Pelobates cultripes]|uniref:Uncharacterized protein n=1 Tax=Pelobates cultripes TaxID=61616 RepID=A0AAD1RFJ5_PELCU|nr:Hypothetical predicted protein [Pelobates cultripes]
MAAACQPCARPASTNKLTTGEPIQHQPTIMTACPRTWLAENNAQTQVQTTNNKQSKMGHKKGETPLDYLSNADSLLHMGGLLRLHYTRKRYLVQKLQTRRRHRHSLNQHTWTPYYHPSKGTHTSFVRAHHSTLRERDFFITRRHRDEPPEHCTLRTLHRSNQPPSRGIR